MAITADRLAAFVVAAVAAARRLLVAITLLVVLLVADGEAVGGGKVSWCGPGYALLAEPAVAAATEQAAATVAAAWDESNMDGDKEEKSPAAPTPGVGPVVDAPPLPPCAPLAEPSPLHNADPRERPPTTAAESADVPDSPRGREGKAAPVCC